MRLKVKIIATCRHGLLDPDDARDMLTWDNSGFSLDASVCIAGHDRAGLDWSGCYATGATRPPRLLRGQGRRLG